jgi:D-alanyl-D-alanine carboxypeptidase (penicillin-binding protein 5/6)
MVAALLLPVLAIAAAAGAADRPQPPPPTPVGGTLSPYPARLATPADRIEPPRISAASALLVDLDGGGVLFRRDPRQPRPVASLTKLMTALVVLRSTPPDQVVTVSRGAVFDDREFGSSSTLGLRAGERLSVRDLLYAALVGSANDAARALAIHVAGSEEAFVRRMNRAADRLGMRATEFRSATGLDDRGVSTAADLRRLAEVVLEQPVLARAVSTRFHRMPGPNRPRIVQSRNALLWLYPGATGMKTGSTRGAGACLIATAERDGRHLLAIVLGAPVEAFSDAAALLNHGFDGFSVRRLVAAGEAFGGVDLRGGSVGVAAADDLSALVPIADSEVRTVVRVDRAATFPPAPNEPVGEVRVVSGDLVLGRVALVATDVPPPPPTGGPPWWVRAAGAVARGVGGLLSAFFD